MGAAEFCGAACVVVVADVGADARTAKGEWNERAGCAVADRRAAEAKAAVRLNIVAVLIVLVEDVDVIRCVRGMNS